MAHGGDRFDTGLEHTALPQLHTPEAIAGALGVSSWWVREQARCRRIPFTMVGGAYRFTPEHLTEIIRIFEQRPEPSGPAVGTTSGRRRIPPDMRDPDVQLRARKPRRARDVRTVSGG